MIYIAGHPILMTCDSKRTSDISEAEIESVFNDLKEFLQKYISENSKFDPFTAEVMYTNLNSRLKGDQLLISWKVCYITDIPGGNKRPDYLKDLDTKQFLQEFKQYNRSYQVLERVLEIDTFILHLGDYKDMEFVIEMSNNFLGE